MLTIKAPITLKNDPSMLRLTDNFHERLMGNYQMLTASLEPEDLLHLVSAPPEVYLAEGGMTSLVNVSDVHQRQDVKLELINNVLNRILVSDTYRMTYQDQVFITSILNKLGVTDVQEFIRQFTSLRQETRNRDELIELYWSHLGQLQELKEIWKLQRKEAGKEEEEKRKEAKEAPLWLHQEIFNRLKTGAVYQEMMHFQSMTHNSLFQIQDTELELAEQFVTAQNILLNKLKNEAAIEPVPLEYHRINIYELGSGENDVSGGTHLKKELVQAVLLNTLDQVYSLRLPQLLERKELWYNLYRAVYQTAENTFRRFEAYHNRTLLSMQQYGEYAQTVNRYQNQEITALHRLLERREGTSAEGSVFERERLEERFRTEGETWETHRMGQETQLLEHRLEHGHEMVNETERESLLTRESEQLRRELEEINRNNVRNQERLRSIEEQTQVQAPAAIDRKRARRDALRAIQEPEEVVLEYLQMETSTQRTQEREKELASRIFSNETREIFETLERYRRTPQLADSAAVTARAQDRLMRDIIYQRSLEERETEVRQQELREELIYDIETNSEVREILGQPQIAIRAQRETERPVQSMELIYKETEAGLDEELLEELRSRNRNFRETRETREEETQRQETVERTVTQRTNRFQTDHSEEIAQLVSRNLQQQIGILSDQIYGKMEKRLDAERRRRGL